MSKLVKGIQFLDPSQTLHYSAVAKMFIDDSSKAVNSFLRWLHSPPSSEEIISSLERTAQTWERLLWTSGGLLNLEKCAYYILQWDFDEEGKMYAASEKYMRKLRLTPGDDPFDVPI